MISLKKYRGLHNLISSVLNDIGCSSVSLNHCTHHSFVSKKSDYCNANHVRIFFSPDGLSSVAFSFFNYDGNKFFTASISYLGSDSKVCYSKARSMDLYGEALRLFVRKIYAYGISSPVISKWEDFLSIFCKDFISSTSSDCEIYKKLIEEYDVKVSSFVKDHNKNVNLYNSKRENCIQISRKVNNDISETEIKKEIIELEDRLSFLKGRLKEIKKSIEDKHSLSTINNDALILLNSICSTEHDCKARHDAFLSNTPPHLNGAFSLDLDLVEFET